MRRALAALLVAAVVLLLWWLRRADRPPAARPPPGRDAPRDRVRFPDTPATVAATDAGGGATVAGATVAATVAGTKEATPPEPAIVPLGEVAADAVVRLRRAAQGCPDAEERATGQSVTLRYVLVIEGGAARLDDVSAVASDIVDADLEDCVVAATEALAWEARGAPDARLGVQETIRIADLP